MIKYKDNKCEEERKSQGGCFVSPLITNYASNRNKQFIVIVYSKEFIVYALRSLKIWIHIISLINMHMWIYTMIRLPLNSTRDVFCSVENFDLLWSILISRVYKNYLSRIPLTFDHESIIHVYMLLCCSCDG